MADHRVEGDLQGFGLPPGPGEESPTLDRGETGHREAVRVSICGSCVISSSPPVSMPGLRTGRGCSRRACNIRS